MRISLLIELVLITALSVGCMTIHYGVNPHTERLADLKPGASTAADVLLTLGEPRGKGAAHLSPDLPLRDIWFYEYLEANGTDIDMKMLIVLMNGDRYDGYLWFSSKDKPVQSYR